MEAQIKSQNDQILNALKSGQKLTPLEMLYRFGCLRASGRIFDLRKKGYNIQTKIITVNKKRVAQYYLVW